MHYHEQKHKEQAKTQAAFRRELRQTVEFAQDQPTTEQYQANGDKVNPPAKEPAPPRLATTLSRMDSNQKSLYQALNLSAWR